MTVSDLFVGFDGREEQLKGVDRFSNFDILFYRSNLWQHEERVALIVSALRSDCDYLLPECDWDKAYYAALVHDDAEIVTGDVQLGDKQRMSDEELLAVDEDEQQAIDSLARRFPEHVGQYLYEDLLLGALRKDTIEAQLVSFADKLDAYCESLHEVLGGNITLLRSLLNYEKILDRFSEKFPMLKSLLGWTDSPFTNPDWRRVAKVDSRNYRFFGSPHTVESIAIPTDLPVYEAWRQVVVDGMEEGVQWLTVQRETFDN